MRTLSGSELARATGGAYTDDGVTLAFNDDPHGLFATSDARSVHMVFGNGALS
jgi:hypothetical protein